MTKKQFTQKDEDDWEILDRGKHFAYAHSGYQAEKIIDELNELVNTNRKLFKENKQLKQQLKICLEHYKCILDETVICNQCQECSKLSADYTADIMRGI